MEEVTADLVIAADGPSSTIRKIFEPSIERKYAGYCVMRGTVPESQGSQAALEVFRERFCFFHAPGIQSKLHMSTSQPSTNTDKIERSYIHHCRPQRHNQAR